MSEPFPTTECAAARSRPRTAASYAVAPVYVCVRQCCPAPHGAWYKACGLTTCDGSHSNERRVASRQWHAPIASLAGARWVTRVSSVPASI